MSDPTVTVQPVASAAQPDPNAFQLRGPQPRVMRLSRKALAVVGVAAGLGIGGSLIYALRPPSDRQAQELYNTDSRTTAETITSGPRDYAQAPRLGPPLPGDLGGPIVSAQQRGENVPVPGTGMLARRPIRARRPRRPPASAPLRSATLRAPARFFSAATQAAQHYHHQLCPLWPCQQHRRRQTRPHKGIKRAGAPSWRKRPTSAPSASSD